jgi:hypothetical protein
MVLEGDWKKVPSHRVRVLARRTHGTNWSFGWTELDGSSSVVSSCVPTKKDRKPLENQMKRIYASIYDIIQSCIDQPLHKKNM